MTQPNDSAVRDVLDAFPDPETGRAMGSVGQIKGVRIDGDVVDYTIGLTSHSRPIADEVLSQIDAKLTVALPGISFRGKIVEHDRPPARSGQLGVRIKSVVLVGSGKGGVGKSTVAASLAVTLDQMGARVGLMDADVYGPSVPHLLGLEGRPAVTAEKKIEPILLRDQFPVMSMGFLVEPDQAVIWRGPMLHGSVTQFLRDTMWGELDYLIIDMPPGTGDIALTLSQSVPISGAVVVCTPQDVALLDAVKAISMFKKVKIPIAGVVENMSGFLCPDNGKTYDIFGRGGARDKAEELDVPFLGSLPLDIALREAGDEGRLHQELVENPAAAAPFTQIARSLVRHLASQAITKPAAPSLPTL